jgi:hypothetical protein
MEAHQVELEDLKMVAYQMRRMHMEIMLKRWVQLILEEIRPVKAELGKEALTSLENLTVLAVKEKMVEMAKSMALRMMNNSVNSVKMVFLLE